MHNVIIIPTAPSYKAILDTVKEHVNLGFEENEYEDIALSCLNECVDYAMTHIFPWANCGFMPPLENYTKIFNALKKETINKAIMTLGGIERYADSLVSVNADECPILLLCKKIGDDLIHEIEKADIYIDSEFTTKVTKRLLILTKYEKNTVEEVPVNINSIKAKLRKLPEAKTFADLVAMKRLRNDVDVLETLIYNSDDSNKEHIEEMLVSMFSELNGLIKQSR